MLFYFLMKSGNLCSLNVDPLKVQVSYLKSLLSKEIGVNEQSIILIANGGLCIQDGILGNYNCADNEENPVFVYLRQQRRTAINFFENNELNTEYLTYMERVKTIINKSGNNFSALQENKILSSDVLKSSESIREKIETDIRNQFFIVEGWSAALANLYDSLSSVEKRIDAMKTNLDKFLYNGLENGYEIMEKFAARKAVLENIPLLTALVDDSKKQDEDYQHPVNLLQWVLSHDSRTRPQVTVQSLISEAHQAYNELLGISDEVKTTLEYLKENWGKIGLIGKAYKYIEIGKELINEGKPMQSMVYEDIEEAEKVIEKNTHTSTKDFLKRLNYLNGFRERSKTLVSLMQTHKEYMEQTVSQCRDIAGQIVLLDHCVSAKTQLDNVSKYYTSLRETLYKVERSKYDLTNNIDIRKTWLQKFQTKICEVDDSIFVVKEKMKRLRTGLHVLDQMQTAPMVYAKGIAEITRRQHYLDFWYSWGIQNSKFSQEIRRKDHEARMSLEQDFENHFIQSLFNSLYSFSLPKLGNPLLQSTRPVLPIISEKYLNELSEHLPQFRSFLKIDKIDPSSIMVKSLYSEPLMEEKPLTKSVSTGFPNSDLFNGISLLPALCDPNLPPINDPSQPKPVNSDSVSNSSSKMVKSIDSMDFQLSNDVATETRKDIVCISRSVLESLFHYVTELKIRWNATKLDIKRCITEQNQSNKEIQKLVIDAINTSDKLTWNSQINPPSITNPTKHMTKSSNTVTPDVKKSNSFQITHKEFTHGDLVCFFGCMVNGAMQWRMISTDNRIYFLYNNNFTDSPVSRCQRREIGTGQRVADFQQTDSSVMFLSHLSTQSNQVDSGPLTMPIVKGIYISKEEYQCKKTTNRYGLPINTKFFRVKADVDWVSAGSENN